MKFQFSHPSKQSGHSYELSSRARMMDEVNNRAMWKRQCSCLEVESLSLQALQRKFKNNLKLFRFAPNVVVSEVPLSLAGLKGETPRPPAQPLNAISHPKKMEIPQETVGQHSCQPARAQHAASALWISLHSPVPSPQAPCLSSCNPSHQCQPPGLTAFKSRMVWKCPVYVPRWDMHKVPPGPVAVL